MWCSECQRFSAAFFHISSLKNANTSNDTAASKQPNSFWFWEKLSYILNTILQYKLHTRQYGTMMYFVVKTNDKLII